MQLEGGSVLFFELERDLLAQLSQARVKDPRKKKPSDAKVLSMLERLRSDDSVVVIATDKTNAYKVVEKKDYVRWVRGHLEKNARKVN